MDYPRPYGTYMLLERLGQGGMSEVDLARRKVVEGGYVRFVVIKRVLARNAGDEHYLTMFKDEARISAQLHHQNIAQVYDFGLEGEEFFLAMEYIPGLDLREIQRSLAKQQRGFSVRIAVTILCQLLDALEFAHHFVDAQGRPLRIVHRDVNPRNVMLSLSGDVKLIDFGVARAEGRLESTVGHSLKGKFAYMSPEQIQGGGVDHRADLFAVGLMIQELLTGRHPFGGLEDVQIMHRVMTGAIPELEPVPQGVDAVLLRHIHRRSTAHTPDKRYSRASELRDDLARLIQPFGGLATRQELASFVQSVEPETIEQIQSRMAHWETEDSPSPLPGLAPLESRLDGTISRVITTAPSDTRATAVTVAAAAGGGALVFGLLVVLLLGVGAVWYFGAERGVPEPVDAPVLVQPVPKDLPPEIKVDRAPPDKAPVEAAPVPRSPRPSARPPSKAPVEAAAVEPAAPPAVEPPPADPGEGEPPGEAAAIEPPVEEEPPPELPPSETGFLFVSSSPQGLSVKVDGKPVGTTPLSRHELAIGAHKIEVIGPDGVSKVESVSIGAKASKAVKVSF